PPPAPARRCAERPVRRAWDVHVRAQLLKRRVCARIRAVSVSMHERPDAWRRRDAPGPFTCSSGGNTRGVLDAMSDLAWEDEMATAKKIDVLTVKLDPKPGALAQILGDRKSTRLNSSHLVISYD